jgi:hypothetical protein
VKTLTLKGSLIGGTTGNAGNIITNSIGTATILGSVHGQNDFNSYQADIATIYAEDHITSLTINGDLIAGNVIAGIGAFNDHNYGTGDDIDSKANIVSKIGKLIVKGSVGGTSLPSVDHYGIEANQIGMISVGGIVFHNGDSLGASTISFAAGFQLGPTNDFLVRTL